MYFSGYLSIFYLHVAFWVSIVFRLDLSLPVDREDKKTSGFKNGNSLAVF